MGGLGTTLFSSGGTILQPGNNRTSFGVYHLAAGAGTLWPGRMCPPKTGPLAVDCGRVIMGKKKGGGGGGTLAAEGQGPATAGTGFTFPTILLPAIVGTQKGAWAKAKNKQAGKHGAGLPRRRICCRVGGEKGYKRPLGFPTRRDVRAKPPPLGGGILAGPLLVLLSRCARQVGWQIFSRANRARKLGRAGTIRATTPC